MAIVQLHDKQFGEYLSAEQIQTEVEKIATEINHDYKDKQPLCIAILNGSFVFAADLFRLLTVDAEICFIKLASYKGTSSGGKVITAIGLDVDIIGRDIIIIEDIIDTGKTLHEFLPKLMHHNPTSLKIAALLHKPDASQYPINIDYKGFTIPNKFVVGYGLDYDGLGRNLKEIYQLI